MQSWRKRRKEQQAKKGMAILGRLARSADESRLSDFVVNLTPDLQQLLLTKWQLSAESVSAGRLARPRSLSEVEALLGMTESQVRAADWAVVDRARIIHRRLDPNLPRFLAVPIDAAQEWWDQQDGWMHNPDGSVKPRNEWSTYAPYTSRDMEVHTIDDPEELLQHAFHDHGLEYIRRQKAPASLYHRDAHIDEAEDGEWDRRFRSIGSPPQPERT